MPDDRLSGRQSRSDFAATQPLLVTKNAAPGVNPAQAPSGRQGDRNTLWSGGSHVHPAPPAPLELLKGAPV